MKLVLKQRLFSWFDSYDVCDEYGNAARHRTLHRVLSRPDRRRHILRSAAASTSGRSSVISLTIRINKIYKSAMLYMK